MAQRMARASRWLAAKDLQPEDIQGPFEIRMRVDPPPGLEFWEHPLWIYGQSDGQNAGDSAGLEFTHYADRKDAAHHHEGWPLKILYPILVDFAENIAADHLVIKIDLRHVEVRPSGTSKAAAIKAERAKYPELAEHVHGWKSQP